ncbi:ParA family protein [Synechococcus elongatus]|uniref:ParA family protein n=1 Tax=Synechococcus elongatus TaxID=32046 RepID=UPI0030D17FCC
MPIAIACLGRKGGVGKTLTASSVAALIAARGQRTLLIDLDPQSNAAFVLGADPAAAGTAEWLAGHEPCFQSVNESLAVLAGGPSLLDYAIARLDPDSLKRVMQEQSYEAFVLDCPPGNDQLERLAIYAADRAVVCTDAHPLAVMGASRVLTELQQRRSESRPGPQQWAIAVTRIDTRRSLDRQVSESLGKTYADTPLFVIRQDSGFALAAADRLPITEAGDLRVRADLQALTAWCFDGQN